MAYRITLSLCDRHFLNWTVAVTVAWKCCFCCCSRAQFTIYQYIQKAFTRIEVLIDVNALPLGSVCLHKAQLRWKTEKVNMRNFKCLVCYISARDDSRRFMLPGNLWRRSPPSQKAIQCKSLNLLFSVSLKISLYRPERFETSIGLPIYIHIF